MFLTVSMNEVFAAHIELIVAEKLSNSKFEMIAGFEQTHGS